MFVDVDNQSVVGAFKRGRAKDPGTHALLVQLFDLQVEHGFILTYRTASPTLSRDPRASPLFGCTPVRSGACGRPWARSVLTSWRVQHRSSASRGVPTRRRSSHSTTVRNPRV